MTIIGFGHDIQRTIDINVSDASNGDCLGSKSGKNTISVREDVTVGIFDDMLDVVCSETSLDVIGCPEEHDVTLTNNICIQGHYNSNPQRQCHNVKRLLNSYPQ